MENYVETLREFLKGRRNISRKLYKFMGTAYRAVETGRITWDYVIEMTGGAN